MHGFVFANYFTDLANTEPSMITINYISEENSVLATLTSLQEDREIGHGRVWISNLEDVQTAENANTVK